MEEQNPHQVQGHGSLFNCFGKKHHEKKTDDDIAMTETVQVEVKNKEEKHTLKDELQRSHSNLSSSSEDEGEGEGEKKRKKKKGLDEKIKKKFSGGNEEDVVVDKQNQTLELQVEKQNAEARKEEAGTKRFPDEITENLSDQQKKLEEDVGDEEKSPSGEAKEKKGIFEKIKEMIPGQHKSDEDGIKEKEN